MAVSAIIGCGNIGSRHLQSMVRAQRIADGRTHERTDRVLRDEFRMAALAVVHGIPAWPRREPRCRDARRHRKDEEPSAHRK